MTFILQFCFCNHRKPKKQINVNMFSWSIGTATLVQFKPIYFTSVRKQVWTTYINPVQRLLPGIQTSCGLRSKKNLTPDQQSDVLQTVTLIIEKIQHFKWKHASSQFPVVNCVCWYRQCWWHNSQAKLNRQYFWFWFEIKTFSRNTFIEAVTLSVKI